MKTEIEAKFLSVDFDELRQKLATLGAVCEHPMRLMRRVIIEPDFFRNAFIRVRDEGDKVTLTYKEFLDDSITGAREQEVIVSDFDDTVAILKAGGLDYRSYQESRRETWRLSSDEGDVEIVLDEWPWLGEYIEIEGPSEKAIKTVAKQIGVSWTDAIFGSADVLYHMLFPQAKNRGVIDIKEVRFNLPMPKELGQRV